jgi:hypothetical protein
VKLVLQRQANPIFPYSYDPRKDGVTQSILATWLECREKARLSTIEGLSSRGSSKPLVHGDVMHRILKRYYLYLLHGRPESQMRPSAWVDEVHAEWTKENADAPTDSKDLATEAAIMGRIIMPRYVARWHTHDSKVKWTMAESTFRVHIPVMMERGRIEQVLFTGQIDGGFESGGKEVLFETKNKGQFSDKLMSALSIDHQLGAYLTALGRMRKHQPKKVLYNLIRRPQERKKKDESLSEFASRVAANIDKEPEHYFERYKVDLSKEEVDKLVFSTEFKIAEFYRWWEGHRDANTLKTLDPMWNGHACIQGYMTCHFIPICANGDRSNHCVRKLVHPELK